MKALIVDNDISKVKAICEALSSRYRLPTVWMAQSCREAVRIFSHHSYVLWDFVFLEHDLDTQGDRLDAGNGQKVALEMSELGVRTKKVIIHSGNNTGADAMCDILSPHYQVLRVPFPEMLEVFLDITMYAPKVSHRESAGVSDVNGGRSSTIPLPRLA